jgi:hypothetical protein
MASFSPSSITASDPRTRGARLLLAAVVLSGFLLPQLAEASDPEKLQFVDVAAESGLIFRHTFGAERMRDVLMTTGSGVGLCDVDDDGWLDAILVNGSVLDAQGNVVPSPGLRLALFRNLGGAGNGVRFEDVTRAAGLGAPAYGQGVACADYDGDGLTDIYLTNYGVNALYRNSGVGPDGVPRFEDVTASSGTGDPRWSTGAVFFDYDGDLDLDLYVANYLRFRPDMHSAHASALSKKMGFVSFPGPRDYEAEDDVLYRNNGDGTFSDVSREAGLSRGGKGLNAAAADFDNDGDQDLFVANDASLNFLYRNDGGRLTEMAVVAGVAVDPQGVETAAMGVDVVDIDADGLLDLFVTNMLFEFNNLYHNLGDLLFSDTTRDLGLDKDNFRHVSWATRFADFDHDGYLDCFVANGHVIDYVEGFSQSITYQQQNMLFQGGANGRFKDVANSLGPSFRRKGVTRGGAFGDYDNDGDLDILLSILGGEAELLRNDLPANDLWLKIRLAGLPPNTDALGARVDVRFGERSFHTESRFASGYLSSSDPTIHVGLGPDVDEAEVTVTWPSGLESVHRVPAGTLSVIEEPARD